MYQLSDILTTLANETVAFLPNLVAAIILLVIGLVVGKIVGRVVKEVLVRLKVDYYITETHKPPVSIASIFAIITRWWIYLAFITAALSQEVLGIPALASWMASINAFIPNVIGAAIIVIAGFLIGEYIKTQLKKTGKPYATLTGKILLFFILYVAIALALPVLGIPATLVNNILLIIIGTIGATFVIAFGLGGRDTAARLWRRWIKKAKL